jgi:hypothetical protein
MATDYFESNTNLLRNTWSPCTNVLRAMRGTNALDLSPLPPPPLFFRLRATTE